MKKQKLCFVASSGGHFEQIMMLKPLMEKYESILITEKTIYRTDVPNIKMYYLHQVNRKEVFFPIKMVANTFKSIYIFILEHPDVIITTGVLAVIPICLLAKLFRRKLIYIESFAKVYSPTKTGKLMYKYADQFYVQWPQMKAIYPKAIYLGGIYYRSMDMIFITLGSQKFQFNRLLKAIDRQVDEKKISDEVFAQIGFSDYRPQHYKFESFLNREEFSEWMEKADIVITHGGTGAIVGALKKGKKVIAVPRLKKYGEHVDDHQLQLVEQFKDLNLICECSNCDEIWEKIILVKRQNYNTYQSNTKTIIESIETFIESGRI